MSATAADVRAWARDQNIPVGTRGHLPGDVIDRFNKAHRVNQFENTNPAVRDRA